MPTASKLAASLTFAVMAYFAAGVFATYLPEGMPMGKLREVSCLVAMCVAWLTIGSQKPQGHYGLAFGVGLRTAAVITFAVTLIFSIYLMVRLAMRMRYDGPVDAVLGVFELMLEQAQMMGHVDFLLTLFGLGGLAGIVTEWTGRRWK